MFQWLEVYAFLEGVEVLISRRRKTNKSSHECVAIAFMPFTTHQLMELYKTRSEDEPKG